MDCSEHSMSQMYPLKRPASPEHAWRLWGRAVTGSHYPGNGEKKSHQQKNLSSSTNGPICSSPVAAATWWSFANVCHCCYELVTLNGSSLFLARGTANCPWVILGQVCQFLV